MGYDVLSMNATALPRVKSAIRSVSAHDARDLLQVVMQFDSASEIELQVTGFLAERGLQQFLPAAIEQ